MYYMWYMGDMYHMGDMSVMSYYGGYALVGAYVRYRGNIRHSPICDFVINDIWGYVRFMGIAPKLQKDIWGISLP